MERENVSTNNFAITVVLSGSSVNISLTDENFNSLKNILNVSGDGFVESFPVGRRKDRRMWYVASEDVSVRLTDHKRRQYWDFVDLNIKVEYDRDADDKPDYYDLVLEFVFFQNGTVKVISRLFDNEMIIDDEGEVLDQLLLDESVAEYHYYGRTISLSIKHPRSDSFNVYVDLKSDIND
jgi:hypothetical protein